MNAKAWARLEKLAVKCADALRDPERQSETIWRGDMWAVIGACHDIGKARKRPLPAPPLLSPKKTEGEE